MTFLHSQVMNERYVGGLYYFYRLFRFSFYFFFSSRRRHTRLQGDWSSDVCSSDLQDVKLVGGLGQVQRLPNNHSQSFIRKVRIELFTIHHDVSAAGPQINSSGCCRSEERRVGKECRSRWSPYH